MEMRAKARPEEATRLYKAARHWASDVENLLALSGALLQMLQLDSPFAQCCSIMHALYVMPARLSFQLKMLKHYCVGLTCRGTRSSRRFYCKQPRRRRQSW